MTIDELAKLKDFSMIALGAGGDPNEWKDGIADILKKEGIVNVGVPTFTRVEKLEGNIKPNGRTDLVLVFNPESNVKVGKLAMWRLRFGDISWTEDFLTNYGKDYNYSKLSSRRKENKIGESRVKKEADDLIRKLLT